ncbi:MAG TPA: OmpA family protein [Nitrospirota bacterium]|nr:OmpA family protein [Nitrospirota bacterium]
MSNTVSITSTALHTPATIEYLQYAPAAAGVQNLIVPATSISTSGTSSGPFVVLAAPVRAGGSTALNLSNPIPLAPASQYHAGEPVFIRVTDLDQNNDPALAETIIITITDNKTGDVEMLRLTETGPNTGVFLGYIQTSGQTGANFNGILNVVEDSRLSTTYTDVINHDTTTAIVLVDPFGIVFSSSTGLPVNGATVTLINANTGAAAAVLGDDGISTFPASVTSGATAMDSSGRVYTFSPGGFRFPFIQPGQYRLLVTPPGGYRAPSNVATTALQALPGAPFAIADPGSRAEAFIVNPGPAIHIDIPIDQVGTRLYLIKTTDKQTAAIGDFVPYTLTVQNTDTTAAITGVTITDRLPLGFRYRKGSASLNKVRIADPSLSGDGRTLVFQAGDLGAGAAATVTFVAEAGAGTGLGKATNTATASGSGGAASNTATATLQIVEELFMSKTTIVGRVIDGCGSEGRGVAGARIFLENGTYVVTDKNGMYHFAAVNPGTHVVQLDTMSIPAGYEPVLCENYSRFAGTAFSQFVDLQGGSMWRADFHINQKTLPESKTGIVGVELRSRIASKGTTTVGMGVGGVYGIVRLGDNGPYDIGYSLPIHVGTVPIKNLRIVVMLPADIAYKRGSSTLNNTALDDPSISNGVLTFRVGGKPADWDGLLAFKVTIPAGGYLGETVTRAFLLFDTAAAQGERTPVVENSLMHYQTEAQQDTPPVVLRPPFRILEATLSEKETKDVEIAAEGLKHITIESITVTGHTDAQPIRPGASKEFSDNYVLSRARARTVADILAHALHLRPDQITTFGRGPDEPIATNETEAGRALNRRVEVMIKSKGTFTVSAIKLVQASSGMKAVATAATTTAPVTVQTLEMKTSSSTTLAGDGSTMPDYNVFWIETAAPGSSWLWPAEGHHPTIASTRLAIKHDPSLKPRLLLNGDPVDPLFYEGQVKKSDNTVAVSFWRGIHLVDGDNRFELVLVDASGIEKERLTRTMHYSGNPVKAVLVPERSKLIADGRNPIVLAVRLLDKDGHPARTGVRGEYSLDPPYLPQKRVDDLQKSPLVQSDADRLRYLIDDDGITSIELAPTTRTGEAIVRFPTEAGTQEVRAWLKPEKRDWILVGLAEGTIGYNTVKGNMETSAGSGMDDKYYDNERLAFYAKGSIKGEWLLTLAYDSKKAPADKESLYQTVDPNKYYTLYGDATEQSYDAASAKHLYIKLERDQFYALFGDYNTGLTVTELSRYNRNFTGFKSELKTNNFEYNLFIADTNQAYVRDEIQGDGTSGLYHLSRKNIVMNSETITLETRDRFRSEVILSSQKLTRYIDYTIDYDAGTLFFKSPVYSRDGNFNPQFIVAEYESFDASDKTYNYGGRVAVKGLDNRVEAGATHIHEGRIGGSGNLEGADVKVKLSEADTFKAEVATSKTDETGTTQKGSAYLAEIQHRSENLEGKAYVREQDTGFGLGQQNGAETGTRKYGLDLNYKIAKPWSLGSQMFEENNLATGAKRDVAELRGRYATGQFDILAGLRHAQDDFTTGQSFRSEQVFAGLRYQLTDRTTVRLTHDQSIGPNDNADYPTRTTLGADYKLNDTSTLFADQEWTHGSSIDTRTTRVGVKASPWTGGQIGSTVEQQATENGVRLFSTTGLKQTWQITKQWSVDGGIDRSTTIRQTGTTTPTNAYTFNTNTPPASGSSEDFTAVSIGVGYREEKWSWTARAENRNADSEHKFGVFTGANGEARPGIGIAGAVQAFRTTTQAGQETLNSDARVGVAYRPVESRVIVLDRLDYLVSEQHGNGSTSLDSRRIVNNFVTNVRADARTQVSFQYAAKYVQEKIDETDYYGYTDLIGLEGRYDITRKWDVGVRGFLLHSWSIDQMKYGSAASVGFNAGKNIWVCVGYNFAGFTDKDFSQANFTSRGPFIKLNMKFDQVTAREAVKWVTGQ